jgi:pSer/pThr/pTyr-binding forkhead associated (FHA) protein
VVKLAEQDTLGACADCGGQAFARATLFSGQRFGRDAERPAMAPEQRSAWLAQVKRGLDGPGQYLAYEDDDRLVTVSLENEWTRVGRSLAADVRFDDPTVSRRHALIVRQPDGVRVLDDRSLNGVFVNGKRVEWSVLGDGDEIVVGRYRLHFLERAAEPTMAAEAAVSAEPGPPSV